MGRASREKWGRRRARLQNLLANRQTERAKQPFWYDNSTAQFLVGLGAAFVLTVWAAMVKDLRWLLWPAWICFALAFFPLTKNIVSRQGRILCIVACIVITGFGLHKLNTSLDPSAMSNQQLCSDALSHAQQIRDFDHER